MECKSFEHNQCVGLMLLKSLTLCTLYIKSKCILWISPFICLVACDLWAIFTAVFSYPIASHHESMSISWCYCGAKLPVYSMLNTYCRCYELKLMIAYVSGNLGSRIGNVSCHHICSVKTDNLNGNLIDSAQTCAWHMSHYTIYKALN